MQCLFRKGLKVFAAVVIFTMLSTVAEFEEHLFDLSIDPFETQDLATWPYYADEMAHLRERLDFFKSQEMLEPDYSAPILARTWASSGGVVPWLQEEPSISSEVPVSRASAEAPHIIFVLADDIGINDVNVEHESTWIPFANRNIERLVKRGVTLTNHFSGWICAPSRAALMTGIYPNRLGFSQVPSIGVAVNLPLDESTLPQEMKRLGYRTALVGKWHLGMQSISYLPTRRGFDTFYGYLSGSISYATKKRAGVHLDLHDQESLVTNADELSPDLHLSTLLDTKMETLIKTHASVYASLGIPLFALFAPQNVHTEGIVGWDAPSSYMEQCGTGTADAVKYCALMLMFDESMGKLSCALEETGMADNSIVIVTSDNGASVQMPGSNYPLRGNKGSMSQGGINTFAFVFGSPNIIPLAMHGSKFDGMVHISDWYVTLLQLASNGEWEGTASGRVVDGLNVLESLRTGASSPRSEVFHNFNAFTYSGSVQVGSLKYIQGSMSARAGPGANMAPQGVINEVTCATRMTFPTKAPTSEPTTPPLMPSLTPTPEPVTRFPMPSTPTPATKAPTMSLGSPPPTQNIISDSSGSFSYSFSFSVNFPVQRHLRSPQASNTKSV